MIEQPRLIDVPVGGFYPVKLKEANRLLEQFGHKLGGVHRPFRSESWVLELDGEILSVAVSASAVSRSAGGFRRNEIVELARLASCNKWVNRVMLRWWREVLALRWESWPVKAAISYQHNAMHSGNLYRFDGWERVNADAGGSGGGGTWSTRRAPDAAVLGSKTLWLWRYGARS